MNGTTVAPKPPPPAKEKRPKKSYGTAPEMVITDGHVNGYLVLTDIMHLEAALQRAKLAIMGMDRRSGPCAGAAIRIHTEREREGSIIIYRSGATWRAFPRSRLR
jgi:hypothetical protein